VERSWRDRGEIVERSWRDRGEICTAVTLFVISFPSKLAFSREACPLFTTVALNG
jgi:hypothetical protein